MRIIKLTVLIAGLLLIINSCCTKKDCGNVEDISEIQFYNFSEAELDTIAIISYLRGSNFKTLIDSSITQAYLYSDYYYTHLNTKINFNLEYVIKLLSTGQVYTLTDFNIERIGCNTCFPYRPKSDYFNILREYQVNGKKQPGQQINIYK
jgi:hypothetical protein